MGVTPAVLRLLLRHCKELGIRGSLLTLGNQDVWPTEQQVRRYLIEEGFVPREGYQVRPSTSALFEELRRSGGKNENFIHARTLFEMMGFEDYNDLDKFERDRPMIQHDLNEPLPPDLEERFDLVLDFGTTEHIFNVPNVLASVARSLRSGGWAIHYLPLASLYWAQHGYYCFNPDLLIDFYRVNGFANIGCKLVYYSKPRFRSFDHDSYFRKARCFDYRSGMNVRYLVPSDAIPMIWVTAQKQSSLRQVRMPSQGETAPTAPASPGRIQASSRIRKMLRPLFFVLEPLLSVVLRRVYLSTFGLRLSKI